MGLPVPRAHRPRDRRRRPTLGTFSGLEIPPAVMDSARLTVTELKLELALALYAQGRLSIGQARELAGVSLWELRQVLAARRIAPHYEVADLQEDAATLRALGRL